MGRKKTIKAKSYVRLRQKPLSGGSVSLYLDTYKDGERSYEFLKLYLRPVVNAGDREYNDNLLRQAEAMRMAREKELLSGTVSSFKGGSLASTPITAWADYYLECKRKAGLSANTIKNYEHALGYLSKFVASRKAKEPTLKTIDRGFCQEYNDWIRRAPKVLHSLNTDTLSENSAGLYYSAFVSLLKFAVDEEIIAVSPAVKVHNRVRQSLESKREFLTAEEVRRIMEVEGVKDSVKRAYLFSCFCGLRYSDIKALTWGDIQKDGDDTRLHVRMQKTKHYLNVFLPKGALEWLPDRGDALDEERVFALPSKTAFRRNLFKIAEEAGVAKHVTPHTARHTFATLSIQAGVGLYQVQEALGQKDPKTTLIYAKLVDEEKKKAAAKIDELF